MDMNPIARIALCGAVLGLAPIANAQSEDKSIPPPEDMYRELKLLREEVAELRAEKGEQFLNEARAEQIRSLVYDVLADADTRSSLLQDAMTAGHDGSNFFLRSADGAFLLKIGGQIQARYIVNVRDNVVDGTESGLQMRRVKLNFAGHIGSPKFDYVVQLAANRDNTAVELEDALIGYRIDEQWRVWGGRFQDSYSREQIMSSRRTLAADRSVVANIYAANDGYTEGVGAEWKVRPEDLILYATINDGYNSGTAGTGAWQNLGNDFQNDATDFALTARAEWKITGDWKQLADVPSWGEQELHAFLGAGIHYEVGETGDNQASATAVPVGAYDSFVQWTIDGLVKTGGLGVMGAIYGWHFDATDTNVLGDTEHMAAMIQAAYMVIPDKFEPFIRYEWIDVDSALATNELSLITVGANYYFAKHNAKFTADLVFALDNINATNTFGVSLTGIGLLTDAAGEDGQVAFRALFQLLF